MVEFFGTSSSDQARAAYGGIHVGAHDGFKLGHYNSYTLIHSPRNVGFLMARHKFVAKMFEGFGSVLEVGCQEGLGTMMVTPAVGRVVGIDFYRPHIESCLSRLPAVLKNATFKGHDIIDGPLDERFDGAYSMDVIEHIDPAQEDRFMSHIAGSLNKGGSFILGTPSLESQKYASAPSREGHINCKTGEDLRKLCKRFYQNVFMFGMNDEVLHTGFLPMAHYLIALCVVPRTNG